MNLKNMNILNFFSKNEVNNQTISLLALSLLPAVFVTKTIEAALVYLLLFVIYIILSTLLSKLINKVVPKGLKWIIVMISFVGLATLISLIANAFFVTFYNEYNIYIYLFAINALPYMLMEDDLEKGVGKSLVNALKSFIGFFIIMFLVAVLREVLGTGMIVFGTFTNISFSVNLFSNYAFSILTNPYGALVILGLLLAGIVAISKKGERL